MLAISVDLLTDRYIASAYNDRDTVEWPPHPARLFSALVATWADGEPHGPEGEAEKRALLWLESQEPPEILACEHSDVSPRTVAPVFVPVNDINQVAPPDRAKLDAALDALARGSDSPKLKNDVAKLQQKLLDDTRKATAVPTKRLKDASGAEGVVTIERRNKQPRTFPSATPAVPTVVFVWSHTKIPEELAPPLQQLLQRLVRLGHSSSFVRASRIDHAAVAAKREGLKSFLPDERRGDLMLRWVAPGQVQRLTRAFDGHREIEPRVLPARFTRYARGGRSSLREVARSAFDEDWIVFSRVAGPRLPITSVAGVSRQLRHALMSGAEEPIPELLSGHRPDGSPSEGAHVAIVPLPFVGARHADGTILGVALVLPRDCDPSERRKVFAAVGKLEAQACRAPTDDVSVIKLLLGKAGVLELQRAPWGETRQTLTSTHWCGPSRFWASATPVALDRNPGDLQDADPTRRAAAFAAAEQIVRTAVARVISTTTHERDGQAPVPPPLVAVDVVRSCVLPGTAKPRDYSRFPSDDRRPQRVLVHVRLAFSTPILGPLLLGAGRYQGLGLCLPLAEQTGIT